MRIVKCALYLLMSAPIYAQDAINVTASRTVDLLPEEVTFNFAVLTEQDVGVDQVLQLVKDSGVAAKDLTGIGNAQYGPSPNQTRLAYQFAMTVPYASFRDTLDKFATVRRNLVASGSSVELQTYFVLVAASENAREQARQQVMPALIEDARRKGEFLAKAAGLSLGSIQGLSDASGVGAVGVPVGGPFSPTTSLKTTFVLSVRFGIR